MIECPECSQVVRGSRCRCGWEVPQAKADRRVSDPQYGQCEWVGDGRCHYAGVFGHGKDGPYYCSAHENCTDPIHGAQIVEQSKRDNPRPDYSFASRKIASLDKLALAMVAWDNRYKERIAA